MKTDIAPQPLQFLDDHYTCFHTPLSHATVGTVHGVMMEMNDKQYKLNNYHTFLPDDFFNFAPKFIEIIN
ncbi:MAG: hypothetical protein V8T35_05270 [Prevotella sp.]